MDDLTRGAKQHAVKAKLFETCFIEIVQGVAEKNKFKKAEFASLVWPESTPQVARNRWNGMRTVDSRTGKPTNCTLEDAYRMAMALGMQMAFVTLQAENLAAQRYEQIEHQDDPTPEPVAPIRRKRKQETNGIA